MGDISKTKKAKKAKDKASKKAEKKAENKAEKKAAVANTPPVWAKATRYEIYRD